jgi:hypothetical protein
MTPQSVLENYTHYGSNIVVGNKLLAHICSVLRKKVVGKHMEFVKLQLEVSLLYTYCIYSVSSMSTVSTVHVPNANKLSWRSPERQRNYLRFYDNIIVAIEPISALIASTLVSEHVSSLTLGFRFQVLARTEVFSIYNTLKCIHDLTVHLGRL